MLCGQGLARACVETGILPSQDQSKISEIENTCCFDFLQTCIPSSVNRCSASSWNWICNFPEGVVTQMGLMAPEGVVTQKGLMLQKGSSRKRGLCSRRGRHSNGAYGSRRGRHAKGTYAPEGVVTQKGFMLQKGLSRKRGYSGSRRDRHMRKGAYGSQQRIENNRFKDV